jgi:hypothetical protein
VIRIEGGSPQRGEVERLGEVLAAVADHARRRTGDQRERERQRGEH